MFSNISFELTLTAIRQLLTIIAWEPRPIFRRFVCSGDRRVCDLHHLVEYLSGNNTYPVAFGNSPTKVLNETLLLVFLVSCAKVESAQCMQTRGLYA